MKRLLKFTILIAALFAAGALRTTWEAPLTKEFRASGLLDQPVNLDTRDRIGQTSAVVAFGGLRTLVATFLNLRATTFFSELRWAELGDTYDTIVDLAPHTSYYWENGSWHLTNNAASYYAHDSDLPPLRRKEMQREFIQRGRAFLERGIRNNPEDPFLRLALGRLLEDPYRKIFDFSGAADAFRIAADSGKVPGFVRRREFGALARAPGREQDALALGRELYAKPENRSPTLLCLMLAMESRADPASPPFERALALFGTAERAYDELALYWARGRERYPINGVAAALQGLEKQLRIPPAKSVFKSSPIPGQEAEDWFGTTRPSPLQPTPKSK